MALNVKTGSDGVLSTTVNRNSGAGSNEAALNGFQLTATPEPGSILLGLTGLLGVVAMRRFPRA